MISQITYEALLESSLAKLNSSKSISAFQQIISYFAVLSELNFCAMHILNARTAAKFLFALLFCMQTIVLVLCFHTFGIFLVKWICIGSRMQFALMSAGVSSKWWHLINAMIYYYVFIVFTMVCYCLWLHGSLEYLLLIGQWQQSEVKYICIISNFLHS